MDSELSSAGSDDLAGGAFRSTSRQSRVDRSIRHAAGRRSSRLESERASPARGAANFCTPSRTLARDAPRRACTSLRRVPLRGPRLRRRGRTRATERARYFRSTVIPYTSPTTSIKSSGGRGRGEGEILKSIGKRKEVEQIERNELVARTIRTVQ